ncbi:MULTISPECIES: RNA polymerase sigma factor SigW [Bacillaceae]|jgi:RNA polymerase sigma-70 factor (ECF subfamily)|uniref:RNA polymerase sigma factor SigW n=1 Tax=Metabacillus hrfriensis TaxID=3048891 RepID=A0ACD4RC26_9BACI|nr:MULTISPECIES: RNA polymerase sigma factor SigW [Bacillaceae]UOK58189.1 RNA polymerase sigma factor SigW [Bacillus sp. OVS6]USK28796.1 RNA polymerase sigma factor SigW [Bacillus sp. CMF21]MDQ0856681.1 RNA polymerase sigma-70 factor (ECF subfamily) [Bacillus sp. V2I10]UAL52486.1 RNA polymerase sigma factor SigW [Metabacillus dongyingensis]WHZ58012.1 RNA polymerase sigma factor SigW [Metabacillus sp. CT-WN-B3]
METIVKNRIKQVKKGDQNAFAEIVDIYKDKIYQLCYRMLGNSHEAEDIAQEAFIRAYVNINSYDMDKKFSTWLYRIATNLTIDRIRKKKPDYYLDAEVTGTEGLTMYSQVAADVALPEDQVETMELQQMIQKEILKLPDKYRTVIVLKYIDELSLIEISEILDMPIGTVKTRIHRGREALRKQLRHL